MNRVNTVVAVLGLLLALAMPSAAIEVSTPNPESLPPLKDDQPPQTLDQLWAGYDPRAEPLETEVLKEWEQEGVILRVVRFRVGVFKGQKAMLAAVYGFPKGGSKLPGLVQIHGGGQYGDYRAPLYNAKRGYATVSLAWAGRISAPGYQVGPEVVKLFWDGKTRDPAYKVTTDWGALDGYHAPRNPDNNFEGTRAGSWTLDKVESPRNSSWFLCMLAARRALTFLEHQPEVDPVKLGLYGHSMGGKLTVLTAGVDQRIKAAAPSCGGVSDRRDPKPLYAATLGDDPHLKRISCPIIFLSPSNDIHGHIDDLQIALTEIRSAEWRITCAPHHCHQDTAEYEVATLLWFDQHLKGTFAFPKTPLISLELKNANGVPSVAVRPDASKPILAVDVYYTQQGQPRGEKHDYYNTLSRFWHYARATNIGGVWAAELPLHSDDKPLWVYANVLYPLESTVTGAGYYYQPYTAHTFNVSSQMIIAESDALKAAGVRPAAQPSRAIESFEGEWRKEWFTYTPESWARSTHKIYDACWRAPAHAQLSLEVRSSTPNKMAIGIDEYAAEVQLGGGEQWQRVVLLSSNFQDAAGQPLKSWENIKELRLGPSETLRIQAPRPAATRVVGGAWEGTEPAFRNLRWEPAPGSSP